MPLEIVSNLASKDSDSLHEQMHAERSCTSTSVHRSVIAVSVVVSRYCHTERIALLANYLIPHLDGI